MIVAQNWTVIGFMAGSLIALVTAIFRSISVQGSCMTEGLAGIRSECSGLRSEIHAVFNGLRNEVNARFDHLENRLDRVETRLDRVETIDREVHALTLKVFGDDPPRSP